MASVTNSNFFSVRLTNITTEVLFLSTVDSVPHEVGLALSNNIEHFGIREERKVCISHRDRIMVFLILL